MRKFVLIIMLSALLGGCQLVAYMPTATVVPTDAPAATATALPLPTAAPERAVVCTGYEAGALNVRQCPGTECWAFYVLGEGQAVTLASRTRHVVGRELWVELAQPVHGWVNSRYLCEED